MPLPDVFIVVHVEDNAVHSPAFTFEEDARRSLQQQFGKVLFSATEKEGIPITVAHTPDDVVYLIIPLPVSSVPKRLT